MAGAKNHDYHILPPSLAADRLVLGAGDGGGRHHVDARRPCRQAQRRRLVFFLGLAGVLFTMYLLVGATSSRKRMPAITRRSCSSTSATA